MDCKNSGCPSFCRKTLEVMSMGFLWIPAPPFLPTNPSMLMLYGECWFECWILILSLSSIGVVLSMFYYFNLWTCLTFEYDKFAVTVHFCCSDSGGKSSWESFLFNFFLVCALSSDKDTSEKTNKQSKWIPFLCKDTEQNHIQNASVSEQWLRKL